MANLWIFGYMAVLTAIKSRIGENCV